MITLVGYWRWDIFSCVGVQDGVHFPFSWTMRWLRFDPEQQSTSLLCDKPAIPLSQAQLSRFHPPLWHSVLRIESGLQLFPGTRFLVFYDYGF